MNKIIQLIREVAGQAQFASFTYKTKETLSKKTGEITKGGEVARYVVILGAKYDNLLEKSLLAAQLLTDNDLKVIAIEEANDYLDELNPEILRNAKQKVIDSLLKSIEAHKKGEQNEDYTKAGQYISLGNGLNVNSSDDTLQMFGLVQSKVILKKGVYKHVNSAIETIATNAIRKSLPIGKFREFALDTGNIHSVKLNGNTLVFDDAPEVSVIQRNKPIKSIRPVAKVITKKQLEEMENELDPRNEERHIMDIEA